ncbi:MAG: hypothetical protein B5M56_06135 [Desulfococcus sp. 4484_241]|nr:MAG: hypothetical protein B5M56_06135 [Desulfococcus sp. 4484_241]
MRPEGFLNWKVVSAFCVVALFAFIAVSEGSMANKAVLRPVVPDLAVYSEDGFIPEYAVLVEKATQRLFLFSFPQGHPLEKGRWRCTTGENHGPKTRAGDKKTPEGIYFFTNRYTDGELAPIYGVMAFPTDYPNLLDRLAGRDGNSIWLHGTNKVLKDYDSNGCVALENGSIEELSRYIKLNHTPIVIVEKIVDASENRNDSLGRKVRELLGRWNKALCSGSYHDYLDLYDDSYLPEMGWWNGWRRLRDCFSNDGMPVVSGSSSLYAVRYCNDYVLFFDQFLEADDRRIDVGKKKFFLSDLSGELKIVGDTYKQVAGSKGGVAKSPLVLACRRLHERVIVEKDVTNMLKQWLAAWSRRDIKSYGSFYSQGFMSDGMNKRRWLAYKRRLNRQYEYVRVAMESLKFIEQSGRRCKVSFVQKYDSDRYSDVGIKTLIIKRENGKWKIYREAWKKLDQKETTGPVPGKI